MIWTILGNLALKVVDKAADRIGHQQEITEQRDIIRTTWELEAIKQGSSSWKDEYLTVILTLPILLQVVGSVWYALSGDGKLLEGSERAILNLEALGLDYGTLMIIIVSASFGIRMFKR